jgi:O-antigen/teichoic acid export membrane protein
MIKDTGPSISKMLLSDTIKYLPATIVNATAILFMLPVLTKLFDKHAYGNYSIAVSGYNFFQIIASTWISATLIRFVSGETNIQEKKIINSTIYKLTLYSTLVIVSLFVLVVIATKSSYNPQLSMLMLIVPLLIISNNLMLIPIQISRANRNINIYTIISVTKVLAPIILGLYISKELMSNDITGMMIGSVIVYWALVIIAYKYFIDGREAPDIKLYDHNWSKRLINYGLPLVPSVLMVQVLDMADRFIVAKYYGTTDAGVFTANYIIASLPIDFIVTLLTGAAAPLIVSVFENNGRHKTEEFLETITRIYIIICAPVYTILCLQSNEIVTLFTNKEYISGTKIIPYVSLGAVLLGLQWIAQRGMILANNTRLILIIYFIAGAVNLIANILLIPTFGYAAAGWTTFGSYLILLLLIVLGSSKFLTLRIPVKTVARVIVSCIIVGLIIHNVNDIRNQPLMFNLLLKTALGALVYVLTLYISGERVFKKV